MAGLSGLGNRRLSSPVAGPLSSRPSLARQAIGRRGVQPRTTGAHELRAAPTKRAPPALPSPVALSSGGPADRPSVSPPAANGNGAPRSERPGPASPRGAMAQSVVHPSTLGLLVVYLARLGLGLGQHLPLITAKEGPHTAPAVSPRVGCGLSQPRNAAYPRFAQEGEAPDGSPSSLARPGRARRKAESARTLRRLNKNITGWRIPLRAVRNPTPLAQVAQG